jgi:hypothetical protein
MNLKLEPVSADSSNPASTSDPHLRTLPFKIMSLAYSINRVRVKAVVGFEAHEIDLGSVWRRGNVLFRANKSGSAIQPTMEKWAHAVDDNRRGYLLWKPRHPKANNLIIQPLDSEYCFEVFPD